MQGKVLKYCERLSEKCLLMVTKSLFEPIPPVRVSNTEYIGAQTKRTLGAASSFMFWEGSMVFQREYKALGSKISMKFEILS